MTMAKKTKKQKNKGQLYTEDLINIVGIENGMIILKDKSKITGIKIMPRNIFILEEEERLHLLASLRQAYNLIDYDFWLFGIDRPVDLESYVNELMNLYGQDVSPAVKKIIQEDIEKVNTFARNNVVDIEYYLLFKERDNDEIAKRIRNLQNGFISAGITVSQTTNEDLRVLLNSILNDGVDYSRNVPL